MSERIVPRGPAQSSSSPGRSAVGDPGAEALRRLRVLCLFISIAPAVKLALTAALLPAGVPQREVLPTAAVVFGTGAVISIIVYFALGNERIGRERRLDIGFGYEVVLALMVSIFRHLAPWPAGEGLRDLSGVVVLILLFAALIPNPPRRTLAASLLAAATDPIGLFIAVARGNAMPPLLQVLALTLPSFAAAGLATLVSRVVHGLARSVDEARRLGSYRLSEKLGSGGMGEVWRAEHHMLARPAAIKLIRADSAAGSGGLRRFEREAQATSVLTSQHTIHLYDFGVTAEGTFYYVMELLDGLDLEHLVQKFGPMPAERVVHVLRQICESLEEAHHTGLVHRDIKPANVYVCRYGRKTDFVKVLDFGLVKQEDRLAERELAPTVTIEGTIAGTPAFLAPEMAAGEGEIDGRTDLYAVGCVGYWLLTGQFVFEAKTPMKMVLAHMNAVPTPPSKRTEIPIPPALERIVLDCLEKDPARRPPSAEALAARLAALELDRPWTPERSERWWDMHAPPTTRQPARDKAVSSPPG